MKKEKLAMIITRYALAASFLSAVADRFGFWGAPGDAGVAWGNMENFIQYTGTLIGFLPEKLVVISGWMATIFEIVFAALLIVGFRVKEVALGSAALLGLFFISMCFALGIKAPLDYSVLTACGASLLLAAIETNDESSSHTSQS